MMTMQADQKPAGIPAMVAARLQRWSVYLSYFDFDIQHINGKDNVNADFLSRFQNHGER